MPRYKMGMVGTCHGYCRNEDFIRKKKKKNEVSDMIAYFELKYPGIKVKKR